MNYASFQVFGGLVKYMSHSDSREVKLGTSGAEKQNRVRQVRKRKGEKKEAMEELCAVKASHTRAMSIQSTSKSAKSPDSIHLQIEIIIHISNVIHLEKKDA